MGPTAATLINRKGIRMNTHGPESILGSGNVQDGAAPSVALLSLGLLGVGFAHRRQLRGRQCIGSK